jgi:asparagine synthase (glutamine-hydrolysing)
VSLLAGIVYRDPRRPADPGRLERLLSAQEDRRGAVAVSGSFAVMLNGDVRPWSGDGSVVLALEADLVNLEELSSLTGREGVHEVVAALYQREGIGGVQRLRGAFAVAIWEPSEHQVLLVVDQIGMRRLYYAVTSEGLVFASRAGLLRSLADLRGGFEPTAIYHYLNFGYLPAPTSITAAIRRLEPGCLLKEQNGVMAITRYWDLNYTKRDLDHDATARATMRHAEAAVARALGSGGAKDTGAFLSGGTDSSTVLGLMSRLSGEHVHAISIGFQERRYDELEYAERAARHFKARHHIRRVSPQDALDALPRLIDSYDEPFGNNSAIGTYLCAQVARECGLTRLLAGDGGDEIFGGNERYTVDAIFARYQRVPRLLRRSLLEPLLHVLPDGGSTTVGRAQRYVRRASLPNPRRFYSYEFFFAQDGRELLDPDFLRGVEPGAPWEVLDQHFGRVSAVEELNRLLYLDMKLTIADNDLLKVTRTAEAAGLGVRFPFLDLPLVEFTATWPASFKVHAGEKRHLFRQAFRDLLPAEILAKRKHGFGVPTSLWLRTHGGFVDLAHDALLGPGAHVTAYFRPGALDDLFRLHTADTTAFYGDLLWSVLMLELWYRRHTHGESPEGARP